MNSVLPEFVLIFAICFNAILAVINGHLVTLARVHVIGAEMIIYVAAIGIIISRADRSMWPWLLLALFIILMGGFISLGSGELNLKYIRDVLVIPVFIMLGMTSRSETFTRPLLVLQTIVFLVGALEIASPDLFADIFRILQYYVNTRDFSANQFWNTESTLFVSATRPGARFFSFVDWHRASSIFLEPVSLGNYCVVATVVLVACWREMSVMARSYMTGTMLFLLVGCDGRLAAISIVIILLSMIVLRHLSSRWSIFYLPAILFLAAGYVSMAGRQQTYDDFVGRVAGTVGFLFNLDIFDLIGLNSKLAGSAADAGIVYFILSQSLMGVAIIWSAICLFAPDRTPASRAYIHGIMIFIPLNLLVSYSFFSIKVAALIWFFYGYRLVKDNADEEVYPQEVLAPAIRRLA